MKQQDLFGPAAKDPGARSTADVAPKLPAPGGAADESPPRAVPGPVNAARGASAPSASAVAPTAALQSASAAPVRSGARALFEVRAPVQAPARPAAAQGWRPGSAQAPAAPAWRRPQAPPRPLTVSELTRQIKNTLEPAFPRVVVRGEVSGFRGPNVRGHLYFSLKDADCAIDVKLWQSNARALKFQLKDGLSVVIEGSVDVYEANGRYSLIVSRIEPAGFGALALAFEQLKARLLAEGLFGEKRTRPRKPLPSLPRRIGVVTSVTGAALTDFLKVLYRRHPRLSVLVADARVQGEGAGAQVARALRWLANTDVDVIVVTRGGGSVEDLWTFNEEVVVRAIFEARVPVISAVGHEVDTTLADHVADVRAPTPSAAAELLAPVLSELEAQLKALAARLERAMERRLVGCRQQLVALHRSLEDPRRALGHQRLHLSESAERLRRAAAAAVRSRRVSLLALKGRLAQTSPRAQLAHTREQAGRLERRLAASLRARLSQERDGLASLRARLELQSPASDLGAERQRLAHARAQLPALARLKLRAERDTLRQLAQHLDALSPLKVLGRGYAIVHQGSPSGPVLRGASEVAPGARLALRLSDGSVLAATAGKAEGEG